MKHLYLILILVANVFSYDRSEWVVSSEWKKSRTFILKRDMVNSHWICKYSGVSIYIKRKVDIDHIIPIKYAEENGGGRFSLYKKRMFANDPDNLVATSAHENRSKGDSGLKDYLPKQNTCWYLSRWDLISKKYGIKVRGEDASILTQGLRKCKI